MLETLLPMFFQSQLLFFSLLYLGAVFAITLRNFWPKLIAGVPEWLMAIILITWTFLGSYYFMPEANFFYFVALFFFVILFIPYFFVLPSFHLSGKLFMVSNYVIFMVMAFYGLWFIHGLQVDMLSKSLLYLSYPLGILLMPVTLVNFFEMYEVLCRTRWKRPREPLRLDEESYTPKVSIHVPSHAEPPEMVIETLNKLAALEYPDYEVLLLDNNTEDEALWRPVQEHCEKLGEQFTFIRLTDWPGAKAGALNYGTKVTDPNAELIAVVDADYHAHKYFLSTLVGYFEDEQMGFVQSPHDYRDWQHSRYLRNCYFEYELFFKSSMVSLNERNSGITVGTMCLIRKQALLDAGGWSEWCLTEDSELAIRIHAQGYDSVYTNTSLGHGLIPETFEGYKKQRFRWTAGPIQEFKHHVRLLLPWSSEPSQLGFIQRVEHLSHGLERAKIGFTYLLTPLGLLIAASLAWHGYKIPIPLELWVFMSVMLFSQLFLSFLVYLTVMGVRLRDALGGFIASQSLSFVITLASIMALFTNNLKWNRTSKFAVEPSLKRAVWSVREEFLIGLMLVLSAVSLIVIFDAQGVLFVLAIGFLLQSVAFFAAVYMAWLAEKDLMEHQPAEVHQQPKQKAFAPQGGV